MQQVDLPIFVDTVSFDLSRWYRLDFGSHVLFFQRKIDQTCIKESFSELNRLLNIEGPSPN